MELSLPPVFPQDDAPPADTARPLVAILDSDPEVYGWLQSQLEPVACQCAVVNLAQYEDGLAAFTALQRDGARLIIYDIGPLYSQNRAHFRELAETAMDANIPLIVTNVLRWMAEEEEAAPGRSRLDYLSAAGSRVVRWVRRVLSEGAPSPESL
jgi:hypothetical protein